MKNYAIWVWRPTDYNPQGQKLDFMDIRYHIQNTPQQSDKQGNDMDYFTCDLRDWANEQIEQGNDEEVITTYLALPEKFFEKRYFYLEYLPDNNFHDFHATLIESANKHGLIVLSDFAEAVFYPDGRSEPPLAIDVIHEAQAEEIQTKLSMYGKKLEDFLEKGSVARSKIQLDVFVNLILKDYFDKKGVKYILKKTQVTMDWQDSKIEVAVHTNFFSEIVVQRGVTMIIPPKKYIEDAEKTFANNEFFRNYYWKNVTINYEWLSLDDFLKNNNIKESKDCYELMDSKNIRDNLDLLKYIHTHLDFLFELTNLANNFYGLVEKIYHDKANLLHQYYFAGLIKQDKSEPSTNHEVFQVKSFLDLLRLIQHPDTEDFLKLYYDYVVSHFSNEKEGISDSMKKFNERKVEHACLYKENLLKGFNSQYNSSS